MSTEKPINTENTTVTPAKKIYGPQAKENVPAQTQTQTHTNAIVQPTHRSTTGVKTDTNVETKPETKVEAKTETKAETKSTKTSKASSKKEEKKETPVSGKPAKKKGKKATWVKKEKVKKTDAIKDVQLSLQGKWKPVFWGRFGKKNLRTRKNPKYDKWRKPRGEDMLLRKDDGMIVQSGYRTPRVIRGKHPSGYEEVLIQSARDFNAMKPHQAARFSGTIGRKKKIVLIKIANEKKIQVLN